MAIASLSLASDLSRCAVFLNLIAFRVACAVVTRASASFSATDLHPTERTKIMT